MRTLGVEEQLRQENVVLQHKVATLQGQLRHKLQK